MDRRLWIFVVLLGGVIVLPVILHTLVKRYVLASILSGVCVGLLFATVLSWGRPTTVEMFMIGVAVAFAAGFVIALGIGIPFNRRRNPTPAEGVGDTWLSRHFTRRMSVIELLAALIFAVVVSRVIRAFAA